MTKFRAYVTFTEIATTEIEAENAEEARKKIEDEFGKYEDVADIEIEEIDE